MEELKRHLQVVVNPQGAVSGELAGAIRSLDETLRTKGETLPGRLRHFLENRSYQKALLWLEGGEPEKGVCGGRG
tara:strand:+ start:517 stop:741 length:225 start_codon:yes stop_codon:yes gene_type:complete